MIEYASEKDYTAIVKLWEESFGDDEEYVYSFIKRNKAPCLVYKYDGEIVSMFFLMDGKVRIGKETYGAKYIYAACTSKEHRCNGYMGKLLKFAMAEGNRVGDSYICLVPSERNLFDYYSHFGFVTVFKKQVFTAKRDELEAIAHYEPVELGVPDFEKLTSLRNSLCGDAFLWDSDALEYAFQENEACCGMNFCLPDNSAYALLRGNRVLEVFYLPESLPELIKLVLTHNDKESYSISVPNGSLAFIGSNTVNNAMLYPLTSAATLLSLKIKDAYFGLALE